MSEAGAGQTIGLGPGVGTKAGRGALPSRQNRTQRQHGTSADVATRLGFDDLPGGETDEWFEEDDAPLEDDVPEWIDDGAEEEPHEPDREPGEDGWVRLYPRLSIWRTSNGLQFVVNTPRSTNDRIDLSLAYQSHRWQKAGRILIQRQARALQSSDLAGAFRHLEPMSLGELGLGEQENTSSSQGSRERMVLVDTPFGLVPLWFFTSRPSSDGLISAICRVANFLDEHGGWPRPTERRPLLSSSEIDEDSFLKQYKPTLTLLHGHPEILASHRARWPLTDSVSLRDEIGISTKARWSEAAANLAIVGAIFSDHETLPPALAPLPNGVAT